MLHFLLVPALGGHIFLAADRWYYCDPARGYFPSVQTCPVPWREVMSPSPSSAEPLGSSADKEERVDRPNGQSLNATMTFSTWIDAHGIRVSGMTNLPDGTDLIVSLTYSKNTPEGLRYFMPQSKAVVKNGRFQAEELSDNGAAVPPTFGRLEITAGLPELQKPNVRDAMGANGQKLSGSLVRQCFSTLQDRCFSAVQMITLAMNTQGKFVSGQ